MDPITAVELDELILRLKQVMNMTIVMITHELQSALKIADRITVLADRKSIFTGTVQELRNSENEYIQNFLNRQSRKDTNRGEDYLRRLTEAQ